ncbi:hypothetical protein V1514DRAFT_370387 [Lipomyces japonicus]|uniref:uncharacterized protein n=1 Tax=Lipomyces japonicus TaxID=56871 RepID=UPI0034CD15BF
MSHYIPARVNWTAENLATTWYVEIIHLHGLPEIVISDRGSLMSSTYWLGNPQASHLTETLAEIHESCRERLVLASRRYKEIADRTRLDITFKTGDRVMVLTNHFRPLRVKRKLGYRYIFGTIVREINPVAYEVKLDDPQRANVHPVFHVSLLEPYTPISGILNQDPPLQDEIPPLAASPDISLSSRRDAGRQFYLVKWRDRPASEISWIPADQLPPQLHSWPKASGRDRSRETNQAIDTLEPGKHFGKVRGLRIGYPGERFTEVRNLRTTSLNYVTK